MRGLRRLIRERHSISQEMDKLVAEAENEGEWPEVIEATEETNTLLEDLAAALDKTDVPGFPSVTLLPPLPPPPPRKPYEPPAKWEELHRCNCGMITPADECLLCMAAANAEEVAEDDAMERKRGLLDD